MVLPNNKTETGFMAVSRIIVGIHGNILSFLNWIKP